jgi:hypothetical protein
VREMVQSNMDRHDQTESTMAFDLRVQPSEGQAREPSADDDPL